MTDLLNDPAILIWLENLVSEKTIRVNFSALSRDLHKHRNTIKEKVERLFEAQILNRPRCPFRGWFKIYPLLAAI